MGKYVEGITFVTIACCNCGMSFAMAQDYYDRRRKDKGWFYCPAGHHQHFTGKSEEQKLREQLKQTQNTLEAESGRASILASQRDQLEKSYSKMRNRVKNGVCPCCTRTFQNLMEHMKSEHPDFGQEKALKVLRDIFGLTQTAVADEIGINAAYISLYEREKPVPEHAEISINRWIEQSAT